MMGYRGKQAEMPTLKWFPPQGAPRTFALFKHVSTVGRALGNDIAIPSGGLAETAAQVLFDGRDFNLEEVDKQAEILINGKKKRRARLVHGDRLTLGDTELQFAIFDEPQSRSTPPSGKEGDAPSDALTAVSSELSKTTTLQQLSGVRKLYEFS
jgi:pSer/pThr/pTyr-binding forkhead associated (FHA) protein